MGWLRAEDRRVTSAQLWGPSEPGTSVLTGLRFMFIEVRPNPPAFGKWLQVAVGLETSWYFTSSSVRLPGGDGP